MNDSLVKPSDDLIETLETIRTEIRLCGKCNFNLLEKARNEIVSIEKKYQDIQNYMKAGNKYVAR